MKLIAPSFELLDKLNGPELLQKIELAGRVCYKSEENITPDSAAGFVGRILKNGHESVLEHEKLTVRLICDRGVSHEIVRHRIASYSQESTRYCNYSKEKFRRELTFIRPFFWESDPEKFGIWKQAMAGAEMAYLALMDLGATAQEARSVLPNSLKTELVVTMDLREWRHFFRLRTGAAAHPQMRELTVPLLAALRQAVPEVFDDISAE